MVQGDTDLIPLGGGHGSSRATYMGGTAIWRAADEIIAKGTRIAAEALEAAEADIRFEDGDFVVTGTDRRVRALRGRARSARGKGTPLDTYYAWTREWMTFPNGDPCRRGRDRPRHRPGDARALHRGRRLRRSGQPDGRRPARRMARSRKASARRCSSTRPTTPQSGQLDRRLVDGLRAAARRRSAALRRSASTRRAARPTRSASRAAAKRARSPASRRSPTRSSTRSPRSASPISPAPPPRSRSGDVSGGTVAD